MNSSQVKKGKGHKINSKELDPICFQCIKDNNFKGLNKDKAESQPPNEFQGMTQFEHVGQNVLINFIESILQKSYSQVFQSMGENICSQKIPMVLVESTYILKDQVEPQG